MTRKSCYSCAYVLRSGDVYFCHKNPPQIVLVPGVPTIANPRGPSMQQLSLFPGVGKDMWCGEHIEAGSLAS